VVEQGSGIPGAVKVKTRETLKVGNFEPDPDETDAPSIVKRLFKRADTTADGFLSMKELSWGIAVQVERHLQDAVRGNFKRFFSLDKANRNGQVEWSEWLKDFEKNVAAKYEDGMNSRMAKVKLASAKASWAEAARTNGDALNIDEFLAFTHPESSHSLMAQTAEETFGRFDADGDDRITLEEYLSSSNTVDDEDSGLGDDEVSMEELKRSEFKEGMDDDGDGVVLKREMLAYMNPKHPYRHRREAERIFRFTDMDGDNRLSLDEALALAPSLLDSKWISPEKAFHGNI